MSYEKDIKELYKDVPTEILDDIIADLKNKNVNDITIDNFLNYLDEDKIKKFILNLDANNISNINISNIEITILNELLKKSGESKELNDKIKLILNNEENIKYLKRNINYFISDLDEQSIRNLFLNLDKDIDFRPVFNDRYIKMNKNFIKLLESIEYNSNFNSIRKIINLNFHSAQNKLKTQNIEYDKDNKDIEDNEDDEYSDIKTKNGFKNYLLYLDNSYISKFNFNIISNSIMIELLNDKEFLKKRDFFNNTDINCFFYRLCLENDKSFLLNIPNEEFEKIEFIQNPKVIIELIEELGEDDKFFEKLKSIFDDPINKNYIFLLKELGNEKINNFLSKIDEINKNEEDEYEYEEKKFFYESFNVEDISNFFYKIDNMALAEKYFMIIGDERIRYLAHYNFSVEVLAKLIKNSDENSPIFKKIMSIDYSYKLKFFKNLLKELDSKEYIVKFINNLPYDISINDNKYKEIILEKTGEEFYKKRIIKEIFFQKKQTKKIDLDENWFDIIKKVLRELSDEEIKKANLININDTEDGKLKEFIKTMIYNYPPDRMPKFDINLISSSDLFEAIKEEKIKSENIAENSASDLFFLKNDKKFNIIQKIIKENNLFTKNSEIEALEFNNVSLGKLASELKFNEILIFIKFYCKNTKYKEYYNEEELKEKLKKELKNVNTAGVDPSKMLYNDYYNPNDNLKTKEQSDGYIKNRQRNKNLLFEVLEEKKQKRFNRIKQLKNFEKREENFTKKYYNKTKLANEKEELNYIIKQYYYETLRRAIVDYSRRIEPFVKEHFDSKKAEEITRNIEDALGILFHPDSSIDLKLEAQKILKNNINVIGKKYKDFVMDTKKEKICGSYLIFSSICNAENIIELNEALYSHIKTRVVDNYSIKHSFGKNDKNKKSLLEVETDKIIRSYGNLVGTKKLEEALYNFTCNPIAQIGREHYKTFDIITKEENDKFGKPVNIICNPAGKDIKIHDSNAGAYTSATTKVKKIIEKGYEPSILSVYFIKKNRKKVIFTNIANSSENEAAIPAMLSENIIFNIYLNKEGKLDVIFNKNADFTILRLKNSITVNEKEYKKGESISEDDLKYIIINKYPTMEKVSKFLDDTLIMEPPFDKNKILGEDEKIIEETNEEKAKKTFETEKRVSDIMKKTKDKMYPFFEKEIINNKNNDDGIHTYIIPDVHGAFDEFIKDLEEMGLIVVNENEFIWYKIDDYGFKIPMYEKPDDYEMNENNYIQIPRFTINKNFNGKVIQLGDLVDSHECSTKSKECLAISTLLSRQLKEKYTTLIGNHEIAKIINNLYGMDRRNVEYEIPVIKEAIKNGNIKLFHHTPGTNIINSHVPLFKDNILNFLNDTVLKNNSVYEYYSEKIERLLKIIGAEKNTYGKYKINDNKCLLDEKPVKENNIEDFVDILNELFIVTVEEGLNEDLLKTLVNENRLYLNERGTMRLKGLSYEKLANSTFKGIDNYVGHDATPIGLRKGYKNKCQKKAYELLKILFTDEWQGKRFGAKFVKVVTDKNGNNKIHFYKGIKEDEKQINDKKKAKFELYSFDGEKIEKVEENKKSLSEEEINNIDSFDDIDKVLYSLNNDIETLELKNIKGAVNKTENIMVSKKDEIQVLGN